MQKLKRLLATIWLVLMGMTVFALFCMAMANPAIRSIAFVLFGVFLVAYITVESIFTITKV